MRPKIGLALGSGGWRGLLHIGVIKYLVENKIPIDFISGSSIGSIIGGLYAATGDIKKVERIANDLNFKKIIRHSFQINTPKRPVFSTKFKTFFKKIVGDINIEDLKIPYSAITCDLSIGEAIAIKKGNLVSAMLASSAIPLVFGPINLHGKYFFDGGMINPVPVNFTRRMGANLVIGVSLYSGIFPIKNKISRLKAIKISRFLYLKRLADIDLHSADIPIELKVPDENYKFFSNLNNSKKLIDYGYKSAREIISKQKNLKPAK
ncbi:MAG: patatin-like phospholipase family protein [Bacteriovorax sp.]|nr:patatin-like phospholipase family protein [Bacteriovorax sp.]